MRRTPTVSDCVHIRLFTTDGPRCVAAIVVDVPPAPMQDGRWVLDLLAAEPTRHALDWYQTIVQGRSMTPGTWHWPLDCVYRSTGLPEES